MSAFWRFVLFAILVTCAIAVGSATCAMAPPAPDAWWAARAG